MPLILIVWLPTGAVVVVRIAPVVAEIESPWEDGLRIDPDELKPLYVKDP